MPSMPHHPRISVDADICFGRPRITGTRLRVSDVLEMLASGASEQDIVRDYPDVKVEDIRAVLSFTAEQHNHAILIAAE